MTVQRIALAAAAFLCSLTAVAGDADFLLVNRTGYPIREIYLGPVHQTVWGPDRLGKAVLGNNQQKQFKLGKWADCLQDMMVVFDDDESEITWESIDLCELHKITLRYNRKSREVSADTE